eukprot:scaffold9478_cov63-Phaeocystis_antarctica.AAC.1
MTLGKRKEEKVLAGDSRGARTPSLARSLRARRYRLDGAMYEFGCCRVSSRTAVCCGVWPCGRCVADGSQGVLTRPDITLILVTALQRGLRRKAVAKLCEWPSSRCVSDSSRYIRWRAQYAARRLVLVKVDLPKGTGGLTSHHHASPSHDRAAHTGGWRRPLLRSVKAPTPSARLLGIPQTS